MNWPLTSIQQENQLLSDVIKHFSHQTHILNTHAWLLICRKKNTMKKCRELMCRARAQGMLAILFFFSFLPHNYVISGDANWKCICCGSFCPRSVCLRLRTEQLFHGPLSCDFLVWQLRAFYNWYVGIEWVQFCFNKYL